MKMYIEWKEVCESKLSIAAMVISICKNIE